MEKNGNMWPNNHNGPTNGNGFLKNDPAVTDEDEIDLKELFYRLWHHKKLIGGSVLAAGFLALLIALLSTPIYQSYGSLMITQANEGSIMGSEEGLSGLLSSAYGIGMGSSIQNELLILQSRNLTREVADTLFDVRTMPNGELFPVLKPANPDSNDIAKLRTVANRLGKKLHFSQVNREANMIKVTFESPSAYEAAFIVNATMKIYQNFSMRQNRKSATAAVQFLEQEQKRIKEKLRNAEQQLRNFMNQEGLVQIDAQTEAMIERSAELRAKKQEAKGKLVAANAVISEMKKRLNTIKPGIATQLTSGFKANMQRLQHALAEANVQKSILLSNYPNIEKREHTPAKLKELNKKIALFDRQIDQLTSKMLKKSEEYAGFIAGANIGETISELNKKLIMAMVQKKGAMAHIVAIDQRLGQQKQFFQSLPDNMITMARLKRNTKISEKLFITVSQQLAEMSLWQQTQFGQGRIIDPAIIPQSPVKPKTILYLLVGLILGGILSVGYVFGREAFNDTIDSIEKLKAINVPMLSAVPDIKKYLKEHDKLSDRDENVEVNGQKVSSHLVTSYDTNTPISEAFRRIESKILHSNPDKEMHTIMVTSATKGEGKTTITSNLATVLAESGRRVLVLETDLRRPNIHNLFGKRMKPGITDVIFGEISVEEVIQHTFMPNLDLLSAGEIPPNPGVVIKSKAFLNVIKEVKNQYDYLLLDTPPFGIITDASSLINLSDGVVIACKFNETSEVQVKETIEDLRGVRANVLGTVMTHFDHAKSKDYSYYGTGYYKKVYEAYAAYEKEV